MALAFTSLPSVVSFPSSEAESPSDFPAPVRVRSRVNSGLSIPSIRTARLAKKSNAGSSGGGNGMGAVVRRAPKVLAEPSKKRSSREEDALRCDEVEEPDAKKRRVAAHDDPVAEEELAPEFVHIKNELDAAFEMFNTRPTSISSRVNGSSLRPSRIPIASSSSTPAGCGPSQLRSFTLTSGLIAKFTTRRRPTARSGTAVIKPPTVPNVMTPVTSDVIMSDACDEDPSTETELAIQDIPRSTRSGSSASIPSAKAARARRSPPPSLLKKALLNSAQLIDGGLEFGSPIREATPLPDVDVDMVEVDSRTYPQRGCLMELRSMTLRFSDPEYDGEVVWEAAKLDLLMTTQEKPKGRRKSPS